MDLCVLNTFDILSAESKHISHMVTSTVLNSTFLCLNREVNALQNRVTFGGIKV